MYHWNNRTKESEKIRFIDVFTAERIIAYRKKQFRAMSSKAIIVGGLIIIIGGGLVTPRVHSGLTYPSTRARDPLPGRVVP